MKKRAFFWGFGFSFLGILSVSAADPVFKSLKDFQGCATANKWDTSVCREPLRRYVMSNPKEAFKAAKLARQSFKAWTAIRFFDLAVSAKGGTPVETVCRDGDFHLAVVSALALPESYSDQALAMRFFATKCFDILLPTVLKELKDNPSDQLISAVCPVFLEKKKGDPNCSSEASLMAPPKDDAKKLPAIDRGDAKVGFPVRVFYGPDGAMLTIAPLVGSLPLVLIEIEGISGAWNGRVMLHQEDVVGKGSSEFWTDHEGKRWVTVVKRDPYGRDATCDVYLPEQTVLKFRYSEDASKSASGETLLDKWK